MGGQVRLGVGVVVGVDGGVRLDLAYSRPAGRGRAVGGFVRVDHLPGGRDAVTWVKVRAEWLWRGWA